ncbi:MAG: acyltransferase [bacterium]
MENNARNSTKTSDATVASVHIQHELSDLRRSRRQQYADLIVGDRRLSRLLLYEAVQWLCADTTGALGLFLRAKLYPLLLGACGHGVVFGRNVSLRHPHKIRLGDGVVLDDNVMLDAKGQNNSGIVIGAGGFIGRNSILSCKDGDIVIEEHVNIGFNAEVFSGSRVLIGANTFIAAYCYLIGGDHIAADPDLSVEQQGATSRGIVIGPHSWLGAGVKVLDGVSIGTRSIAGAGAVVTRDIPDYAVAAGVPAHVLRDRRDQAAHTPTETQRP